jgi:outer membrane lipoprotein carrier protein
VGAVRLAPTPAPVMLALVLAGVVALALALGRPPVAAAAAAAAPAATAEDGAALLKRIYDKNAALVSLQAPFTQVKESSLFASSITTTGKIAFARPGRLRWEVTSKPRSVLVVNGPTVLLSYPDLGKREKFDRAKDPSLGALFDQLFVWLGAADPAKIAADYALARAPGAAALAFTPLRDPVKSALAGVTVAFDPATLLVQKVDLAERSGDTTAITFGPAVVNAPVADALFDVK